MKYLKQISKYSILSLLTISLASCSAEDGETGAQGPQGEQGVPGQDGTNGQDGNANVTSVLFENQTINNGDNEFDIPELTQSIYDAGIVYAYVTVTGNDYWEALPISLEQQIVLEIDKVEVGKITLKATFTQSNLKLRFILVEGNLSSTTPDKNISSMSYQEVMDYFGLKH